jgi:uncharacterized protein with NRDE domain
MQHWFTFFSHVPIFAKGLYGTRSTAVLSLSYDGEARFYEKYLESGAWKNHTVHYQRVGNAIVKMGVK